MYGDRVLKGIAASGLSSATTAFLAEVLIEKLPKHLKLSPFAGVGSTVTIGFLISILSRKLAGKELSESIINGAIAAIVAELSPKKPRKKIVITRSDGSKARPSKPLGMPRKFKA